MDAFILDLASIEVRENTRLGWLQAQREAYEKVQSGYKRIELTVNVDTMQYDLDSSDVTNLRYYFPLCHSLQQVGIKCSLSIKKDYTKRVFDFLKYSNTIDPIRKTIFVDGKKLAYYEGINKIKTNDIFPLIITYKDDDFNVLKIINEQNISILTNAKTFKALHVKIDENGKEDLKSLIDDLTITGYDEPSAYLAKTIAYALVERIFEEYEQDDDPDYTIENLAQSYHEIINSCILSARSYADGIYQIIENAYTHSQGKVAFWGFRIHKADKNANMSKYAKESQTRLRLYEKYKWCFTNHYPNGGIQANPKISGSIFTTANYKYFLEIYVLDDAVQYVTNSSGKSMFVPMGIVEKIRTPIDVAKKENEDNSGIKEVKEKVFCIEDIFLLQEKDYLPTSEYFIKHYGLRWFDKTIKNSNGLYYIITPHRLRSKSFTPFVYYSHKKYDPKEKRAVPSVVAALKELPVPVEQSALVDNYTKYSRFDSYRFLTSYCYDPYNHINEVYCTEYNILLPIAQSYKKHIENYDKGNLEIFDYIEKSAVNWADEICNFDLSDANNTILSLSGRKTKQIEIISGLILESATMKPNASEYRYLRLNVGSLLMKQKIRNEIIAKALFLSVYKLRNKENNDRYTNEEILFVLDFEKQSRLTILEFVRVFSIFYDKIENGSLENHYMQNVQIALCYNDGSENKVVTVIVGEQLKAAYESARAYLYHNGADSVPFLNSLSALLPRDDVEKKSDDKNSDTYCPKIYPFDIRLFEKGSNKSWFINRIGNLLERDYQDQAYGCKINNTHIRVSSRIHMTEFYEAELLFHSISNVYKFAEILADEIIKDLSQGKSLKTIVLVGYEKYSSTLILRLQEVLYTRKNINVYAAIVVKEGDGLYEENRSEVHWFGRVKYSSEKEKEYDLMPSVSIDDIDLYSVVPVGSTMSTSYKVQDIVKTDLLLSYKGTASSHFKSVHNYMVVAVLPPTGENDEVVSRYLKRIDSASDSVFSVVEITPQRITDGVQKQTVKYLLEGNVSWHDADKCEVCTQEKFPLVHLDKTSTLPKVIFEERDNNKQVFSNSIVKKTKEKKSNDNKSKGEDPEDINITDALSPQLSVVDESDEVKKLKCSSYLTYAHICNGDNHYQFYFDFDGIAHRNLEFIKNWAKKIDIDKRAFNIVVSPLSESNSVFLKVILDGVFESTARFLHIDIGMYKEDVRAKFSYIAKEISDIVLHDPQTKINFYFVDNSTSQGTLLQRSKMLMTLILGQSGLSFEQMKSVSLYKKLFLLVNRSSYDTIKLFLNDPHADCHAFYNVQFPAFNMKGGECPTCKLQRRYEILRKKSSTVDVASAFARLVHKHEKRSLEEYNEWLTNEILNKHAYLGWLKLWLTSSEACGVNDNNTSKSTQNQSEESTQNQKETRVEIINIIKKQIKEKFETNFPENFDNEDCVQDYLEGVEKTTINKLFDDETLKHNIVELVKYVVAQRAVVRFEALQKSYDELMVKVWDGKDDAQPIDSDKLIQNTEDAIWDMLCYKKMKQNNVYDDFEWIESCVKAICREQIVNYYRVRNAVFAVLKQLFAILTKNEVRLTYHGGALSEGDSCYLKLDANYQFKLPLLEDGYSYSDGTQFFFQFDKEQKGKKISWTIKTGYVLVKKDKQVDNEKNKIQGELRIPLEVSKSKSESKANLNNNDWRELKIFKRVHSINKRTIPVMCQYNLSCAIAQGLAFLHSFESLGFDKDEPNTYENIYNRTLNKFQRKVQENGTNIADNVLFECPSKNQLLINRVVAIKTATMLEEDDSKCFKLIESLRGKRNEE